MKYSRGTLSDFIEFNPRESLPKGNVSKEIAMADLMPFQKKISNYNTSPYKGGMKFRNGDTLLARITPCLENGKTAYVDILNEDEVGFGSTEYIVLRAIPLKTIPEFVFYFAISDWFRKRAIALMTGSSGRQRVQTDKLMDLEVIMPDLEAQKKIVRILSAFDQKIELNNSNNRVLYSLAESIFKERFKGKIYGHKTVGDYIMPKRGKALLSKDTIEGPVPVVAGGLEAAARHNKSNTTAPVVTISASGANAGFVRLWGEKVWSSDSSFIDDSITRNIYFWYVLLKSRQKEIYDAQTGSAQAHIYPKHIGDMSIGDISDEEISKYNNSVKPMFEKITLNDSTNKSLSMTRDLLLPELMSGEIDLGRVL